MQVHRFRALVSLGVLLTLATAVPSGQTVTEPTVYVTRTGAKYHRDTCASLSRSRIPKKLSVAAATYGPCKNCRPPIPKASARLTPLIPQEPPRAARPAATDGRCQATTKKGAQCKRRAQSGQQYCWQHP